jgi:hypothetical protein
MALGLVGSVSLHGTGRWFKSSPTYQKYREKGHPLDGLFFFWDGKQGQLVHDPAIRLQGVDRQLP